MFMVCDSVGMFTISFHRRVSTKEKIAESATMVDFIYANKCTRNTFVLSVNSTAAEAIRFLLSRIKIPRESLESGRKVKA